MTSAPYFVREIADLPQRRDAAVHGEHAVGGDESRAAVLRVLEMLLQLGQVAIGVSQPPRLAEPDAVDDAGVIERVGNDRVLFAEHGFEQPAIGVPARGIQDGVFGAEEARQRRLELLVHRLRTADEAHRGHAVTETVDCPVRGFANRRMAGKSQVIVSAQVDDVRVVGANLPGLRAGDHPFGLEEALLA